VSDDVVTLPSVPQDLSAKIARVAEQHAVFKGAIADERDAEAELLERLIAMLRPALPAVSTKPILSQVTRWHGNVSTSTQDNRAEWRGLRVQGDGAEYDHPRDNAGSYKGTDLYLRSDGTWCELAYSGNWSRWQGATTEWTSELSILSSREVADQYDLAPIVETLVGAIDQQLTGSTTKRTATASERAKKLRALAALL